MRGVVYVDILVLVNAVIAFFLLKCTGRIASVQTTFLRLSLSGLLAGLSSLMLLLPPMHAIFLLVLKMVSAILIIITAFPLRGVRRFLKACVCYYFLNLALSGVIFAFTYYRGDLQNVQINNLSVYFNVTPITLITCSTLIYCAIVLYEFVFGKKGQHVQTTFVCQFSMNGQQTNLHGVMMLDSGFSMKDPMLGDAAFLVSFASVQQALPKPLSQAVQAYFELGELKQPLRLVITHTAVGVKCLPAIRAKNLQVNGKQLDEILCVFSHERLAGGMYDAIINPNEAD